MKLLNFSTISCQIRVVTLALSFGLIILPSDAIGLKSKQSARVVDSIPLSELPLSFEANQGQAPTPIRFIARRAGYTVGLSADEAILSLPNTDASMPAEQDGNSAVHIRLLHADSRAAAAGLEQGGNVNYFTGRGNSQWRSGIPTYKKAKFQAVYPGIDIIYYGRDGLLEYDFVVAPGGDPAAIKLGFAGAREIRLDECGDLLLHAAEGTVRLHKPVSYQLLDGQRRQVVSRYVVNESNEVRLAIGDYDRQHELVIDPVLSYSAVFSAMRFLGMTVDAAGHVYVAGSTGNTFFTATPGAYSPRQSSEQNEIFVAKLNLAGSDFVYATYLRGMGRSSVRALAIDGAGNVYVVGTTSARDFPTTPGAFQQDFGGPATATTSVTGDLFVLKLNADGSSLAYSTYLGGSGNELAEGITVDQAGSAYVIGNSGSSNFPITPGAALPRVQNADGGNFLTKLNANGSALAYSTFLRSLQQTQGSFSGSRNVAVDSGGNACVAGFTNAGAILLKLNASGSAFLYSTLLSRGGLNVDLAYGVVADNQGNSYVTGVTHGSVLYNGENGFQPVFGGQSDAFVSKVGPTGQIIFATYLGGSGADVGNDIALDAEENVLVTGTTSSGNFPVTSGALQPNLAALNNRLYDQDLFVTKLNKDGKSLKYSTYLGSGGADEGLFVSLDGTGRIYLAGDTGSGSFGNRGLQFPVTPGALFIPVHRLDLANGVGGFVIKLDESGSSALDLTVTAAGSGDFVSGSRAAFIYQVANVGATASFSTIRLDLQFPGLPEHYSGEGWQCMNSSTPGSRVCTYNQTLRPGELSDRLFLSFRIGNSSSFTTTATLTNFSDTNPNNNVATYTVTQTTPCPVSLAPVGAQSQTPEQHIGHAAANHAVAVDSPASCQWKAHSNTNWITVNTIAGSGQGPVNYTVERNPGAAERAGTISVNNNSMLVFQKPGLTAVSAASFSANPIEVAPASIVALFGDSLATEVRIADLQPLPTSLGGTQILISRHGIVYPAAQLFFVSPNQINFLFPAELPTDQFDLVVTSGSGIKTGGKVTITSIAPGLFSANATGQGVAAAVVLRVHQDGSQSFEPVAVFDSTQHQYIATPIDFGPPSDQLFLILFGTGLRNAGDGRKVSVTVGAIEAPVLFVGAQGGYAGLDQVNVSLPRNLTGSGDANINLTTDSKVTNTVKVKFK